MGKRSNFKRRPQDRYDTPYECVPHLLPFLKPNTQFVEPCAGKGLLIDHLERHGHKCIRAYDIKPRRKDIERYDALQYWASCEGLYITNPPWTREILHALILSLSEHRPAWLLFDADWAFTKQSIPYMSRCRKIVPVGRVKWIPGSKYVGKDSAAWYLFDATGKPETRFYPRAA